MHDDTVQPCLTPEEASTMALLTQILEDFDLESLQQMEWPPVSSDHPTDAADNQHDEEHDEEQAPKNTTTTETEDPTREDPPNPRQETRRLQLEVSLLEQQLRVLLDGTLSNQWQTLARQQWIQLLEANALNHRLKQLVLQKLQIAHWFQCQLLNRTTGDDDSVMVVPEDTENSSEFASTTCTSDDGSEVAETTSPARVLARSMPGRVATSTKRNLALARVRPPRQALRPRQRHAHYQARLRWLQGRLLAACARVDLVFQKRHLKTTPTFPSYSLTNSSSDNLWCRELHIVDGVSSRSFDDRRQGAFVELAGFTECCFDVDTLNDLLWKCFVLLTRNQSVDQIDMAGNVFESFETSVSDDIVHGTARFEITTSEKHLKVTGLGAMRKFPQVFVWEAVGRVDVVPNSGHNHKKRKQTDNESDLPDQIEFTRTVWFRVEELPDGRSILHHVHHMQPVVGKSSKSGAALRQQLELFGAILQRVHGDMASYFQALILDHLAGPVVSPEALDVRGWPLDSTW